MSPAHARAAKPKTPASRTTRPAAGSPEAAAPARTAGKTASAGAFYASGPAFSLAAPVLTKLVVGAANDPFEREADAVADRVVAGSPAPPITPMGPSARVSRCACDEPVQRCACEEPVQRSCACQDEPVQRAADGEEEPVQAEGAAMPAAPAVPPVAAQTIRAPGAGAPLQPAVRNALEPRLGADLSGVRVHGDGAAHRAAASLGARAFTRGSDIWLGAGESQNDLRLMAHEATHVVQQDGLVRRDIDPLATLGDLYEGAGAVVGEAGEALSSAGAAVGDALSSGADAVVGFATEALNMATAFAAALGGAVSTSGTSLVVSVPRLQICPTLPVQLSLFPIPIVEIPVINGILPLTGAVNLYGSLSLGLSLTPEVLAQLGPCYLNGLRIVIDPLGLSFSAAGSVSVTVAAGLGAVLDARVRGEVGMLILAGALPIQIPVVGAEVGLAGQMRGIAAATFTQSAGFSFGAGSFTAFEQEEMDLGLAADLGFGAYGQVDVLGVSICRLYWPLWEWHGDLGLNLTLSDDLAISAGGAAASLSVGSSASLSDIPFSQIPLAFDRSVLQDDCPLCDALYRAGLMPSQRGGNWTGHPAPPWPDGPLSVYPRAPGIASGSKCRGACGPDCETCRHEAEHAVCEETPDGCHVWWIYPNYEDCGSHLGCRNHDACYDWCAAGGESSIWGPCHRVCDFECGCGYGVPQCAGWIGGGTPHDRRMVFSDAPRQEPGCRGPCPAESKADGGLVQQRLCLPLVTVFERGRVLHRAWSRRTGELVVFSRRLQIPYIPPPLFEVFVRGEADAAVDAGVGPATLEGVCLVYDPAAKSYSGVGELHVRGDLNGLIRLTGILGARAGWGCLASAIDTEVLRGEAGLSATGIANLPLDLAARVTVSCRNGQLVLDAEAWFDACLRLRFMLDALLRVLLFKRFEIFSGRWNLVDREWEHCWNIPIGVASGAIAPAGCGGALPGAAGALGLGAPAGPPAVLGGGGGGGGAAPGAVLGTASALLGSGDDISVRSLLRDLMSMAGGNEDIDDLSTGELPADPAAAAGASNPCRGPAPPDDCANPIDEKLTFTHRGFTWELRVHDRKHTRMANRTHAQINAIAALHPARCGTLAKHCEQEFCNEVDQGNNAYGSQITSETRDAPAGAFYLDLVQTEIQNAFPRPPSGSGRFNLVGVLKDQDVGFDVRSGRRMTRRYRIHGQYRRTGPKALGEAHLFPEAP